MKTRFLLIPISLIFVTFVSGCLQQEVPSNGIEIYFKDVELTLSDKPLLNKAVELIFTIHTGEKNEMEYGYGDVSVEIVLPEGFELVDGNVTWNGYIEPNGVYSHKIIIKSVKKGDWSITAWAGPNWNVRYDGDTLYISVTDRDARILEGPPVCTGTEEEVRECMRTGMVKK